MQPWAELGNHETASTTPASVRREREQAPARPAARDRPWSASGQLAPEAPRAKRRLTSQRRADATRPGRWPSTCSAVNASHTKKLTLWIGSSVPRDVGPTNRSATPLANTTTVEITTIGAISAQRRGRRPLAPVARVARVVADEPVAGARQLQRERSDQQHAHEQVHRQQRSEAHDRHADHRQQQRSAATPVAVVSRSLPLVPPARDAPGMVDCSVAIAVVPVEPARRSCTTMPSGAHGRSSEGRVPWNECVMRG